MKINLSSTMSYYISLEDDLGDTAILQRLAGLGYKKVIPVRATRTTLDRTGIAKSHFDAIGKHLAQSQFSPFIIFEEDAAPFNYKDSISIPDDADAVYLGIIGKNEFSNPEIYPVSGYPGVYRLKNSLGLHAKLYITERYARAAHRWAAEVYARQTNTTHIDGHISSKSQKYNIYVIDPVFYQLNSPHTESTKINSLLQYAMV